MAPGAVKRAFNRVSRAGLAGLDRQTARYVQGSNHYLLLAWACAAPFEVFLLVADGGALARAAVVHALLIAVWVGCWWLNVAGWVRTSSVIALAAPLLAYFVQTWLLSYRAGFLIPMLMAAAVAFVTITPRIASWGIGISILSAVAVCWSFLDSRVATPRLDASDTAVNLLLVGNIALTTIVIGATSWLNHHYFTRERQRAERRVSVAQEQARTDPLTLLANRRGMVEALAAAPSDRPYAVALIDLDRFKEVNDTLGHERGDAVLAEVARVLREILGHVGVVSRWGGEEFLVLMTDVRLTAAVAGIERARKAVEQLLRSEHDAPGVTFSAGLAAASPGLSWETTVRVADALLYDAKDAGRNCVRYAQVRGDLSEWDA